jgi:hypothetical protein
MVDARGVERRRPVSFFPFISVRSVFSKSDHTRLVDRVNVQRNYGTYGIN